MYVMYRVEEYNLVSVSKWEHVYIQMCVSVLCVCVQICVCVFVQYNCIWIENLGSKPLKLLTVVTYDEWEVEIVAYRRKDFYF